MVLAFYFFSPFCHRKITFFHTFYILLTSSFLFFKLWSAWNVNSLFWIWICLNTVFTSPHSFLVCIPLTNSRSLHQHLFFLSFSLFLLLHKIRQPQHRLFYFLRFFLKNVGTARSLNYPTMWIHIPTACLFKCNVERRKKEISTIIYYYFLVLENRFEIALHIFFRNFRTLNCLIFDFFFLTTFVQHFSPWYMFLLFYSFHCNVINKCSSFFLFLDSVISNLEMFFFLFFSFIKFNPVR